VGENARRWRANRLRRNCTWTPSPDLRCAPLIRPRPLHQLTCAHRERICHWGLGSLGHTALLHPPAKAEARLMPFSPPRPPCGASPRCLSPPTRCVGHALTSPYRSCVPQRAAPRKFEVTRMKPPIKKLWTLMAISRLACDGLEECSRGPHQPPPPSVRVASHSMRFPLTVVSRTEAHRVGEGREGYRGGFAMCIRSICH
jgi:hypothetical protein